MYKNTNNNINKCTILILPMKVYRLKYYFLPVSHIYPAHQNFFYSHSLGFQLDARQLLRLLRGYKKLVFFSSRK